MASDTSNGDPANEVEQGSAVEQAGKVEQVGLLFVHGIGQQERWEHLRASVVEIAELLGSHCGDRAGVSVVDRIADWQGDAGRPDIAQPAPITISLRQRTGENPRSIDFHCHEVWWADLGKRRGLLEGLRFWVWGLGQWGAPIYLDLDASKLAEAGGEDGPRTPRPKVQMPRSVALDPPAQFHSRLSLFWAGVVAALAAISISLFKRVATFVAGATPSTTLIVDYVGDVQVYTQRARPGKGPVSDPGHPWRVAIRRRMVSEMVAMGARDFDRWYIFAHSLGSVVAFNGIGEIGHTLPNYLPRELWESLPDDLKRDPECAKRDDVENMMPARPVWLEQEDCINRPALFENLSGFITYGSPLDKFAALWPRIVAVERYGGGMGGPDRRPDRRQVFPLTRWVNILSPTDPVAGHLDRYHPEQEGATARERRDANNDLPALVNVKRPGSQFFGLSHIRYFEVKQRCDTRGKVRDGDCGDRVEEDSEYKAFYDRFFGWLTTGTDRRAPAPDCGDDSVWPPFAIGRDDTRKLRLQAIFASLLIWLGASVIFGLVLHALLPSSCTLLPRSAPGAGAGGGAPECLSLFSVSALAVLVLGMAVVYLCGTFRWFVETRFDARVAAMECDGLARTEPRHGQLTNFIHLARWQQIAALVSLLLVPATAVGGYFGAGAMRDLPASVTLGCAVAVMLVLFSLAAYLQSSLNALFDRRKDKGA